MRPNGMASGGVSPKLRIAIVHPDLGIGKESPMVVTRGLCIGDQMQLVLTSVLKLFVTLDL